MLNRFIVGDPPPIPQQVAVPILAPAEASVARLDRANKALHVVIRAWQLFQIVALEQLWTHVVRHMQEMQEAPPLTRSLALVWHLVAQRDTPGIKALPGSRIGDR
jgi:hypothetical protein